MQSEKKNWKDQWTYMILAGVLVLAVVVGLLIKHVKSVNQKSEQAYTQEQDEGTDYDLVSGNAGESTDDSGESAGGTESWEEEPEGEPEGSAGDVSDTEVPEQPEQLEPPEPPAEDAVGQEAPAQDTQGYILPDSDRRYYKMKELKGLSAKKARLARNELFARHGRKFDDEELQAYFNSCSWYSGTIEPDDFKEENMFNKYEIANRNLIIKYETKKGYR